MDNFKLYFLGFMSAVLIGSLAMNFYLTKTYSGHPPEIGYQNEQRERLADLIEENGK